MGIRQSGQTIPSLGGIVEQSRLGMFVCAWGGSILVLSLASLSAFILPGRGSRTGALKAHEWRCVAVHTAAALGSLPALVGGAAPLRGRARWLAIAASGVLAYRVSEAAIWTFPQLLNAYGSGRWQTELPAPVRQAPSAASDISLAVLLLVAACRARWTSSAICLPVSAVVAAWL